MLKQNVLKNCLLFVFAVLVFASCESTYEETYIANVPQYMSFEEFRKMSIKSTSAQAMQKTGKMYFKDNYLFINEITKGVHVIDNSNPAAPQNIAFIEIPGNVDISIVGNTMYADSYVDLLVLDISDIHDVKKIARYEDAFPQVYPNLNSEYPVVDYDHSKGIVIGWTQKRVTEEVISNIRNDWGLEYVDIAVNASGGGKALSPSGIGGSMARFKIYRNYLYAVDKNKMHVFDISSPTAISEKQQIWLQWNAETIFMYNDRLFIGTQSGMMVFSLENPKIPSFISSLDHLRACDPVVVENDIAYVTLRAGSSCGNVVKDQLDVIDISDIYNPQLLKSYPMEEPYGLGIDNGTLFVCDGTAGLKVYDATDPLDIDNQLIANFKDVNAFDVIPLSDVLMLIGSDGLYQYDYSDPQKLELISFIAIGTP